jgi:hypothetical protein
VLPRLLNTPHDHTPASTERPQRWRCGRNDSAHPRGKRPARTHAARMDKSSVRRPPKPTCPACSNTRQQITAHVCVCRVACARASTSTSTSTSATPSKRYHPAAAAHMHVGPPHSAKAPGRVRTNPPRVYTPRRGAASDLLLTRGATRHQQLGRRAALRPAAAAAAAAAARQPRRQMRASRW